MSGDVAFSRGIPPGAAIPAAELGRIAREVLAERGADMFQYPRIGGYPGDPALLAQLARTHGVPVDALFVSSGSLQVLDLVTSLLARGSAARVAVESPTYDRAIQILGRGTAGVYGVPVDGAGMDTEALRAVIRKEGPPSLLYTIPDFQNPSGVTTSLRVREELVALSREHGFPIVEDIPYRDLRYTGDDLPLIREIAGEARVITIGSLSKTLSPGLRVGYALSDLETTLALAELAESTYLSPTPLSQAIAARALSDGLVERNLRRVRSLIGRRCAAAVLAARQLPGVRLLAVPEGGYYLSAYLASPLDEAAFVRAARRAGVIITRGSAFYPPGSRPPAGTQFLRLPFQSLEPEEFSTGLRRLALAASAESPAADRAPAAPAPAAAG